MMHRNFEKQTCVSIYVYDNTNMYTRIYFSVPKLPVLYQNSRGIYDEFLLLRGTNRPSHGQNSGTPGTK